MNNRPRILLLDHTAALSGAELAMLRMVRGLDRSRFDLRALFFSDGPLVAEMKACGVPVEVMPLSERVVATSRHGLGSALFRIGAVVETARYIVRLARYIRANRIDLVHTYSLKSDVIGGLAALLASRLCIWSVHDRIANDYMPTALVYALRWLSRALPAYLIANSNSTLQALQPYPKDRCRVIYPGVDLSEFTEAPAREDDGRPVVAQIGRISPTKGQDIFLRASVQVLREFPKARFQIMGGAFFNDAEYEKKIRALANDLGVSEIVEFCGFVNDVAKRLATLDILVLPSTTPEPFGQIVTEAMAIGKPVVATSAGGVTEIVEAGHTGLLVEAGNVDQLAEAICRLLRDPEEARLMGQRGRQRVAKRFAIEQTTREVEKVYDTLLARTAS